MNVTFLNRTRQRWGWALGAAGIACGALAWQYGPRSFAVANDFLSVQAIGEFYTHDPADLPFEHLGDVPPELAVPRSMADIRVRQYDELDRPRFGQRLTHRGAQINSERFTVVAMNGPEEAQEALEEFTAAWEEFSRLADTFTQAHRNPDFAIGQVLIVLDNEPLRDRDEPKRTMQIENGQTIVYLNVAPGEPTLEEQLPELRQGAVLALLHLAELDRRFPLWAQQGLAEYTAAKVADARQAQSAQQDEEDDEGFEPSVQMLEDNGGFALELDPQFDDQPEEGIAENPRGDEAYAGMTPIGGEYWRWQRSAPDRLEEVEDEQTSEALQRVKFLLEGDDAEHAPAFLLALRELAEEPTDPWLASRAKLAGTQLLAPPGETVVDELVEDLEEAYAAWVQDPLRGQPLFLPGGDIPDPAMLSREKQMEVVLKLAYRMEKTVVETGVRPRITEFGADGQREIPLTTFGGRALDVERLYQELSALEVPWATIDARGELLLWTDDAALSEALGVEENRYTSEYRDGHWVLVTAWDDSTQLEAWLEPNENNPSRPLVRFGARPKDVPVQVAELDGAFELRRR